MSASTRAAQKGRARYVREIPGPAGQVVRLYRRDGVLVATCLRGIGSDHLRRDFAGQLAALDRDEGGEIRRALARGLVSSSGFENNRVLQEMGPADGD